MVRHTHHLMTAHCSWNTRKYQRQQRSVDDSTFYECKMALIIKGATPKTLADQLICVPGPCFGLASSMKLFPLTNQHHALQLTTLANLQPDVLHSSTSFNVFHSSTSSCCSLQR